MADCIYFSFCFMLLAPWRSVRVAEGARLERVCALTTYHGFESHLLRVFLWAKPSPFLNRYNEKIEKIYLFVRCEEMQTSVLE